MGEQKYYREFLKKYIPTKPGIIRAHDGETCGKHEGLSYYTIGQRKGHRIGGG
jgi:Predicted tRNA(5-methylaminomethyl-2-thiouridylate) methyltransferase, contains the PP-loop ATPase domain